MRQSEFGHGGLRGLLIDGLGAVAVSARTIGSQSTFMSLGSHAHQARPVLKSILT
jgi:hypothetical protein